MYMYICTHVQKNSTLTQSFFLNYTTNLRQIIFFFFYERCLLCPKENALKALFTKQPKNIRFKVLPNSVMSQKNINVSGKVGIHPLLVWANWLRAPPKCWIFTSFQNSWLQFWENIFCSHRILYPGFFQNTKINLFCLLLPLFDGSRVSRL